MDLDVCEAESPLSLGFSEETALKETGRLGGRTSDCEGRCDEAPPRAMAFGAQQ